MHTDVDYIIKMKINSKGYKYNFSRTEVGETEIYDQYGIVWECGSLIIIMKAEISWRINGSVLKV